MLSGYKLGMKAILPHWSVFFMQEGRLPAHCVPIRFDDCIKLQQCLSENDYLWPEPPCLASRLEKPRSYIERLQIHLELSEPPRFAGLTWHLLDAQPRQKQPIEQAVSAVASHSAMSASPHAKEILNGKRIYIAESCDLGKDGLGLYQSGIKQAGGKLLSGSTHQERLKALQRADFVIANYRQGWEFWKVRIHRAALRC